VTVYLVRHGETTWNAAGRLQGWAASSLSGRGREQARAAGQRLAEAGVDRLVTSDLARAEETARLIEQSGVDASRAAQAVWRERDIGDYQGLDRETIAERHPAFERGQSITVVDEVPGGESLATFRQRVTAGWESLRGDLDGETVALVTHGGPLRAVVAAVTGQALSVLGDQWSPGNCCVTAVDPVANHVVRRDDCTHL
jgi:probable phosphoglycerate mutase